MKKHIVLGTALLLTLGTAVAGTLMYGNGQGSIDTVDAFSTYESATVGPAQQPSPEVIAYWKATASSTDYLAPKVPI